jgi:acyl-coenzyme A thioesterase PaaI-like protein
MASAYKLNRLAGSIRKMESYLPKAWHPVGYSLLFNNMVKLAGTAGLRVEKIGQQESTVYLDNRKKVQNHIGGLHACSMVLAAESATGLVVGYNVPDTHIPLMKSMNINFVRRCQGAVRATAALSDEDLRRIHQEDRGDVKVKVRVVDESGKEPIEAEMTWAWVRKNKS